MTSAPAAQPPRIWLVLGDKVGDNRQVERVAEALGWPFEIRRVRFRPRWREGKPPFLASLYHLDPAASDPLEPPWPDLVLTIGRRPAMAALWIKRQSGGRTRLVIFGRPKRFIDEFDLIVVPSQYARIRRPNVHSLALPLIRIAPEAVAVEAERWRERLAELPRPLTVLLVGGRTKPYRMDAAVARDLLEQTVAEMPAGGSLFISTSRRTPAEVVEVLDRERPPRAHLHRFDPTGDDNPYLALLGLGDRFVVTGDSVSMLTEIARLGRDLAIYPLPRAPRPAGLWRDAAMDLPGVAHLRLAARRRAWFGWARDLGALHALLVARGWARWLGRAAAAPASPPEDELAEVVGRIRRLGVG